MKKIRLSIVAAALVLVIILLGCQAIPTKTEGAFFDITTNYVPHLVVQTNVIPVYQTNLVVQTITTTNQQLQIIPVTVTNPVVQVSYQTNVVQATQTNVVYSMTPNATTQTVASVGGAIGAPFGVGGLVSSAILGAAAIWGGIRNRQFAGQNTVLTQSAGTLAQIIETGREVMKGTPQGTDLEAAFMSWVADHQNTVGTAKVIDGIVENFVQNPEAKRAAQQIQGLLSGAPPSTAPPTATKV